MTTRPAPPSGRPPPVEASLEGGVPIDLVALAEEICRRYRAEFPDEQERYGDAGIAWCLHDNQYILNWTVLARNGYGSLERELAWLARVLAARDFPLERLRRNLEIAADVARERVPDGGEPLADDLEAGARSVPARA